MIHSVFTSLLASLFVFANFANIGIENIFSKNLQNNSQDEIQLPIIFEKNSKKFIVNSHKMAYFQDFDRIHNWQDNWNVELFSCGNKKVFGLDGDISVVTTPKAEIFFDENMATGNFFDCENSILTDYNGLPYSDEKNIFIKISYSDTDFEKISCEKNGNNFVKILKNDIEEKMTEENHKICEEIEKKFEKLQKI